MKIRELLELTKTERLAEISKDRLPAGEKKVRAILKSIDCVPLGVGKSGWVYEGDDLAVLEKDISEFLPSKATPRKAIQEVEKKESKQTKKTENHNIIKEESKPTNKEEIKQTKQVYKKVTYEIEEWLHDELRVKAIREKRKVSEIVNELIKKGLAE